MSSRRHDCTRLIQCNAPPRKENRIYCKRSIVRPSRNRDQGNKLRSCSQQNVEATRIWQNLSSTTVDKGILTPSKSEQGLHSAEITMLKRQSSTESHYNQQCQITEYPSSSNFSTGRIVDTNQYTHNEGRTTGQNPHSLCTYLTLVALGFTWGNRSHWWRNMNSLGHVRWKLASQRIDIRKHSGASFSREDVLPWFPEWSRKRIPWYLVRSFDYDPTHQKAVAVVPTSCNEALTLRSESLKLCPA